MTTKKTDNKTEEKSTEKLEAIEVLKQKNNISDAIFAGMKMFKGWAEGKKVTEEDFLKAKKDFLQAPVDKTDKK